MIASLARTLLLPVLVAPALLLGGAVAHAEDFLPPGALQYEDARLPNGLRLIVQRVHSAPYVSARLVVKTGTDHYPCDDRELPHLVEHLLFSANDQYAENEIDDAVTSWGGNINAYTYAEQTEVVLDAHSRFQADAMQLLAAMIGRFAPGDEDVAREANVVERESGTDQSAFRLWWTRQPAVQLASTQFSLAAGLLCAAGITPVHHLSATDVRRAFDTYYVPANMVLILVGDLDEAGIRAAREAFSALPAQAPPRLAPAAIAMPPDTAFVSGWLSGTAHLDRPTAIGLSPFTDWEGYYALQLVEAWLNDRMYRELRSERGIAYTPVASLDYHGSALSMVLAVETESADTRFTRDYLQALVDEVGANGIPAEDFEELRTGALLGMAQSFERISDRADYLSASIREIESGHLFDVETFYETLDHARFQTLVARDWPARFAVMDDSPRVSWSARMTLLGGSLALLVTGIALLLWRRLRASPPG